MSDNEKALGEATATPTAHEVTTDDREALLELLGPILHLPISEIRDRILAAGFRRTEVPEPSAEVRQVLAWIDHTLGLPMYQDEMHSDYDDGVVTTLKTVRKMLNGTSRPDASWRSGEPSDAQEPLDLKGLAEIIGDVVVACLTATRQQ